MIIISGLSYIIAKPRITDRIFYEKFTPFSLGASFLLVMKIDKQLIDKSLSSILSSMRDGLMLFDGSGNLQYLNEAAEEILGWYPKEVLGKSYKGLFQWVYRSDMSSAPCPVEGVFKSREVGVVSEKVFITGKTGEIKPVSGRVIPILEEESLLGVVLLLRDQTEHVQLQNQTIRNNKNQMLGVVIGGIAHDFKNLLTGITGNLSYIKEANPSESDIKLRLETAGKAGERASDLAQQLMTFTKDGGAEKAEISLRSLLKESSEFIFKGTQVSCDLSLPDKLWFVYVNEGQISQVVNNLLINAIQAVEAFGAVSLKVENVKVGEQDNLPLDKGRYLRIEVQDEGEGIPPENIAKLFNPYFTTKKAGNGLGLASCKAIVDDHMGHIEVRSKVGHGSSFYVYLPATDKEEGSKLGAVENEKEDKVIKGHGHILVMDDEELIQQIAGDMLKFLGYSVDFAANGEEAIALFEKGKREGTPYTAVILDLSIPGSEGGEIVMKKLLKIDPGVKGIVSTGYSHDPIVENPQEYGFSAVALKPYNIKKLSQALHSAFDN